MKGETLQVIRGAADKHGNAAKSDSHTVEGIFAWGAGRSTTRSSQQDNRQESSTLSVELYVPRTTSLKQRDRLRRSNGETYEVLGTGAWDQNSPMTGRNFGMKVYHVRVTT